MRVGWSRYLRGLLDEAQSNLTEADSLYARVSEIGRAWAAVEPTNAKWNSLVGRMYANRAEIAAYRSDWAAAAENLEAGRRSYEQLVETDPTNLGFRRGAAIVLNELAEAESALGRTDRARHAWLASLAHFEWLAERGTPLARLEWAYGLSCYAAFERRAGRLRTARKPIEHALQLALETETLGNHAHHLFYRAAVLAEVGYLRAARGRARAARAAWRCAADLLHELAAITPLDPDGRQLLVDLESALTGRRRIARGGSGS